MAIVTVYTTLETPVHTVTYLTTSHHRWNLNCPNVTTRKSPVTFGALRQIYYTCFWSFWTASTESSTTLTGSVDLQCYGTWVWLQTQLFLLLHALNRIQYKCTTTVYIVQSISTIHVFFLISFLFLLELHN